MEELFVKQEYRTFIRKKRCRVLLAAAILLFFWFFIANANNPNTSQLHKMVLLAILSFFSLLELYWIYTFFIKKPRVLTGVIEDIKVKERTVKRADNVETRYTKVYKVRTPQGSVRGKSVASYIGSDNILQVGDNVIWFLFETGNGYII